MATPVARGAPRNQTRQARKDLAWQLMADRRLAHAQARRDIAHAQPRHQAQRVQDPRVAVAIGWAPERGSGEPAEKLADLAQIRPEDEEKLKSVKATLQRRKDALEAAGDNLQFNIGDLKLSVFSGGASASASAN